MLYPYAKTEQTDEAAIGSQQVEALLSTDRRIALYLIGKLTLEGHFEAADLDRDGLFILWESLADGLRKSLQLVDPVTLSRLQVGLAEF